MFLTARQLQELHRASGGGGRIVLPQRSRLTPLAMDWIKARKLSVAFSDATVSAAPAATLQNAATPAPGGYLWWCDGPCGAAKAALVALEKQMNLRPLDHAADARELGAVIGRIAAEIKSQRAAGAALMVQSAAAAVVMANRCPSVRAIVGTCLGAVEQGISQVAANVLIIEHPYQTFMQARNLLSRFIAAPISVN